MGGMNPPPVPNPLQGAAIGAQVANVQQGMNKDTAQEAQKGSMVNQYNPLGSLEYTQTGTSPEGTPLYSAKVSLSPEQQHLFDLLQGTKGTAGAAGQSLLTNANYGGTDPREFIGDSTKGLTSNYMKAQTDYLDPFFTTQRDQLDTKLKNQGLAPGMPAYDNAMRSYETNRNMSVGKLASDFEPEAYKQATASYLLPGMQAMQLSGFGAPGDPKGDFVNAPALNYNPANLIGAVTGQQSNMMEQYKAQMDQYKNMMSGLMGIPTAVLGGWAKGGFPGAGNLAGMFGGGEAAAAGGADAAALGAEAAGMMV